jgi:hypothetical protein
MSDQKPAPREDLRVVDSLGVFFAIVWTVLLTGGALFMIAATFDATDGNEVLLGMAFTIPLVALAGGTFMVARAKRRGTVVHFDDRTVSLPGGGVAAKSFLENLSPKHWIQMGRRFDVPIDEITQLAYKTKWTAVSRWKLLVADKENKDKIRSNRKLKHVIQMNGTKGTVSIAFRSEPKADEVLAAVRSMLPKGTPVIDPRMGFDGDEYGDE